MWVCYSALWGAQGGSTQHAACVHAHRRTRACACRGVRTRRQHAAHARTHHAPALHAARRYIDVTNLIQDMVGIGLLAADMLHGCTGPFGGLLGARQLIHVTEHRAQLRLTCCHPCCGFFVKSSNQKQRTCPGRPCGHPVRVQYGCTHLQVHSLNRAATRMPSKCHSPPTSPPPHLRRSQPA